MRTVRFWITPLLSACLLLVGCAGPIGNSTSFLPSPLPRRVRLPLSPLSLQQGSVSTESYASLDMRLTEGDLVDDIFGWKAESAVP